MQPKSAGFAAGALRGAIEQTMSNSLPRPPKRPPEEPIIIKDPSRQPAVPEVDRPVNEDEDEEDVEIWRPPEHVPDMPPPRGPEERAR